MDCFLVLVHMASLHESRDLVMTTQALACALLMHALTGNACSPALLWRAVQLRPDNIHETAAVPAPHLGH